VYPIHNNKSTSTGGDQDRSSLLHCLTECETGEKFIIESISCGKGAKQRLANLGLVPGTEIVKFNSAPFRGPIQVKVKGSSLVIGRGLASKIMVTCSNTCSH